MSIFEYDEEKEIGRIRKEEREIGKKIGEKQGLMQGAINMIAALKKLGISRTDTISNIIDSFSFTKDEAEELVGKYWD